MAWENVFDRAAVEHARKPSTLIQDIAPARIASGLMQVALHGIKSIRPAIEHADIDRAWMHAERGHGPLHDLYLVAQKHVSAAVEELDNRTGNHVHQAAAWLDAKSDPVIKAVQEHWAKTRN